MDKTPDCLSGSPVLSVRLGGKLRQGWGHPPRFGRLAGGRPSQNCGILPYILAAWWIDSNASGLATALEPVINFIPLQSGEYLRASLSPTMKGWETRGKLR